MFVELDMLDLERTLAFVSCVAEKLEESRRRRHRHLPRGPQAEGGVDVEGPVKVRASAGLAQSSRRGQLLRCSVLSILLLLAQQD